MSTSEHFKKFKKRILYRNLFFLKQILVLAFLFLNFAWLAGQSTIILSEKQNKYTLTNKLEYFKDSTRSISINDVLKQNIVFKKVEPSRLNFPKSNNVYWFRFSIKDVSAKGNNWIVEFNNPVVEDIRFFLIDSSGVIVNEQKGGLKYNQNQVEIVFRNPIFQIKPNAGKYNIILRIDTRSAVYTHINIYKPYTFWSFERTERSLMFLLSGILLAISILNLVLFILTREWAYLLLSVFLSFTILLFLSLYGYLFEFFPDLSLIQKVKARIISYQISIILLSFFSIKFLDIKRVSKVGYKILSVLILFFVLFLICSLTNIIPAILEYQLVVISYPAFVFIQISVIIIAVNKQNTSAIYYLVSFSFYSFISIIFLLVTFGVISGNIITNNISIIGTTIFSLLLTVGLNEKFTKLRKLQSETIQLARDKNELAQEIKIRVKAENALKKSKANLKEANNAKDRFFSILAHDLINPFNTILGFGQLLKENIKDGDTTKTEKYINLIHKTATRTFKLLENLLEWSRSQTNTIEYNPKKLDINAIITDIISLFDSQIAQKGVEISTNLEKSIVVFADLNMIKTVIRNLLSNAVKFTSKGTINISTKSENNYCIISVKDTGVGISEKDLNNLFKIDIATSSAGTNGEKGTGIGLVLCNEFITKNKGEISVKSKKGEGSTFIFSLPISN